MVEFIFIFLLFWDFHLIQTVLFLIIYHELQIIKGSVNTVIILLWCTSHYDIVINCLVQTHKHTAITGLSISWPFLWFFYTIVIIVLDFLVTEAPGYPGTNHYGTWMPPRPQIWHHKIHILKMDCNWHKYSIYQSFHLLSSSKKSKKNVYPFVPLCLSQTFKSAFILYLFFLQKTWYMYNHGHQNLPHPP